MVIDDISKMGQESQPRSDLICIFKLGGNFSNFDSTSTQINFCFRQANVVLGLAHEKIDV